MGLKKTFRRFWICFGILLFVIIVHRSISLPLIVLRNAIESHWLSSHSPLCSLFPHSNLLETNFKIVRNEFIEPTKNEYQKRFSAFGLPSVFLGGTYDICMLMPSVSIFGRVQVTLLSA